MSISFDRLQLMMTFIKIAGAGSISKAARELQLAQSSVSRQLKQLEDLFGTSLVHRTTHKLSLTEKGNEFLADCHRLVRDWDGVEERFRQDEARPRGKLKVVASLGIGQLVLVEFAARYCQKYPDVQLDWQVFDGPISILDSGVDCLIRVGRIVEQSVITRVVAYLPCVVVACPQLAKKFDSEALLRDFNLFPLIHVVPYFQSSILLKSGKRKSFIITGEVKMVTNNIVVAKAAAVAGVGFTVLPRWLADPEIKAGRLCDVLPEWEPVSLPISIGTPPAKHKDLKTKLFIQEISKGLHHFPGILPVKL